MEKKKKSVATQDKLRETLRIIASGLTRGCPEVRKQAQQQAAELEKMGYGEDLKKAIDRDRELSAAWIGG